MLDMLYKRYHLALTLYCRKNIILVGMLGIASGLPLLITLSVLSYGLSKAGIDKTTIGLLTLTTTPYTLKFLWAPLIDSIQLPILGHLLGQKRSWALLCQLLLIVAITMLGFIDPKTHLTWLAICTLCVAFLSATQDIAIDAIRIDLLKEDEQGAGAAIIIGGYRLGMFIAGGLGLILADYIAWSMVHIFFSICLIIGILAVLLADEPERDTIYYSNVLTWFNQAVVEPLRDIFKRDNIIIILLFIILYKYGDAFSSNMATPFYVDVGFSGTEIGLVTKTWGLGFTLGGAFIGGIIIAYTSIIYGLLIGGILQAITNLAFIWLYYSGHDVTILAVAIGADNFTGGIGTVALVAYLSMLTNKNFTATQYALFTSFMAISRTYLAAGSGYVVDQTSWPIFFILSVILALPALILLYFIPKKY